MTEHHVGWLVVMGSHACMDESSWTHLDDSSLSLVLSCGGFVWIMTTNERDHFQVMSPPPLIHFIHTHLHIFLV